ncbi:hypothetical protein REY75_04835 [Bacillus sp. MHSD_37]|uniref:hypothetical protein n=1 Tax=Bacillus sp. MHSD_37 TaxID=3073272 RepID=UPI0028532670|nr:hypothetical protein [Bacillus sp. MHSD_37]MDR4977899.1 hypothetical protein [Bacillus sp. MHSD_37]
MLYHTNEIALHEPLLMLLKPLVSMLNFPLHLGRLYMFPSSLDQAVDFLILNEHLNFL